MEREREGVVFTATEIPPCCYKLCIVTSSPLTEELTAAS